MEPDKKRQATETTDVTLDATAADDGGTPRTPRPSVVGCTISHYKVTGRLGAGGMGEVYSAEDLALDRKVALKLLPANFEPWARERLLREAWASARVQHPAIATFYEAGHADGVDFIAMEFVAGETLRDHVSRGPLAPDESLRIVSTVLEGLVHAHFEGILHRDIKPENIMITEQGSAKLLDLGLAKGALMQSLLASDRETNERASGGASSVPQQTVPQPSVREASLAGLTQLGTIIAGKAGESLGETATLPLDGSADLTQAGAILGTPGYMAPEQLRGIEVDARADVFAVGATLYEMLAGQRAFAGSTAKERMYAILRENPPPLDEAAVSAELSSAVFRALARDPADRYASASAFLADLRRLSGPQPGAARALTLAVFPFQNLSGNEDIDWIASAVTEGMRSRLMAQSGVQMVPAEKLMMASAPPVDGAAPSRTEIGLRLACNAVISGAVNETETGVALFAKVTDVAVGIDIVDGSATGTIQAVEGLEEQLTSMVVEGLGLKATSGSTPRTQSKAYELYARAFPLLYTGNKGDNKPALDMIERAIELEPRFTKALSVLSAAYATSNIYSFDPALNARAIELADRAIECDPEFADPHVWKGYALYTDHRYVEAYRSFRRAIELDPSNTYAYYFGSTCFVAVCTVEQIQELHRLAGGEPTDDYHAWGRAEAARMCQMAVKAHPGFCWAWAVLGMFHTELGNLEEARWCIERAAELEPIARPPTAGVVGFLGECLRRAGDLEGARVRLREAIQSLEESDHLYRDLWRGLYLCMLGKVAVQQGDAEAARALFQQAAQHIEGRARARCAGHVRVQALAGLAQATGDVDSFGAAMTLFDERKGYDFTPLLFTRDDYDLVALSKAAAALGNHQLAEELAQRARDCGATEQMY